MTTMHSQSHVAKINANVNAPAFVELFDENGKAVQIPQADESYWLGKGYTRARLDPGVALSEFIVLMDAAKKAVQDYAANVKTSGVIDHRAESARAAAYLA